MKVIGLCGGSGSGKGSLCEIFREIGIPSIDTDAVYHELTRANSPCLEELVREFGSDILTDGGSLDRKKLSRIVFFGDNSKEKLERLNKISHYFVLNKTRLKLDNLREQNYPMAVVDAPLLFESGFDKECDAVLALVCDRETRILRIMKRDLIDRESAERRIDSQLSDEVIISRSDYVITNDKDIDSLKIQVLNLVKNILVN